MPNNAHTRRIHEDGSGDKSVVSLARSKDLLVTEATVAATGLARGGAGATRDRS